MVMLFMLMALQQNTPVPEDWISILSKGSPYLLAVVIVALMTGVLVPKWVYTDKVEENKILSEKLDQANGVILDLLRKAGQAHKREEAGK